jgi:hypothetical protein
MHKHKLTLSTTQNNTEKNIFSLSKVHDTIKVNLFRIDIYWELCSASFLSIASSKNISFRVFAVETLGSFIIEAFNFIENSYKSNEK